MKKCIVVGQTIPIVVDGDTYHALVTSVARPYVSIQYGGHDWYIVPDGTVLEGSFFKGYVDDYSSYTPIQQCEGVDLHEKQEFVANLITEICEMEPVDNLLLSPTEAKLLREILKDNIIFKKSK